MSRDRSIIAVLLFDRAPLFEQSVPVSVFGVDRTPSGAPPFTLLTAAGEPGILTTTGGIRMHAPHDLGVLGQAGIVIVPSWRDARERPPESALRALRDAHADGALIVGLCMGAFVLAASGLLDGRRAVTHWFHAPALAEMYPHVRVDPDVLYADDGDVVTSAGTAAGLDACLHVVRRIWGASAATSIARRMVTPPQRAGGQAQYIDQPLPPRPEEDEFGRVMAWALAHLDEAIGIDDLAARACLSRRTFDRRFRAATGMSPLQWLLHQRVLGARTLLERTELPVDHVARKVGLGSAVSLRQPFRRLVGVSPQQYRATFRLAPAREAAG